MNQDNQTTEPQGCDDVEIPNPEPRDLLIDIFGVKYRAYLKWLTDLNPLSFIIVFAILLIIFKVIAALLLAIVTYPFSDWNPPGTVDPRKILSENGYG